MIPSSGCIHVVCMFSPHLHLLSTSWHQALGISWLRIWMGIHILALLTGGYLSPIRLRSFIAWTSVASLLSLSPSRSLPSLSFSFTYSSFLSVLLSIWTMSSTYRLYRSICTPCCQGLREGGGGAAGDFSPGPGPPQGARPVWIKKKSEKKNVF